MALDALMTKTATINSATSFFPTGPIAVGGSNVDEFDLYIGNKGVFSTPLACYCYVPSGVSGTNPTLDITLESDDNTSFSSAQTRLTAVQITGTSGPNGDGSGKYFLFWLAGIPERYVRFKATAAGTNPNFGLVTFAISDAEDNAYAH